jgi:hypothetical protein
LLIIKYVLTFKLRYLSNVEIRWWKLKNSGERYNKWHNIFKLMIYILQLFTLFNIEKYILRFLNINLNVFYKIYGYIHIFLKVKRVLMLKQYNGNRKYVYYHEQIIY